MAMVSSTASTSSPGTLTALARRGNLPAPQGRMWSRRPPDVGAHGWLSPRVGRDSGKTRKRGGDQVPSATREEPQAHDDIDRAAPSKAERKYAEEKSKVSLALFASFMAILLSI